MPLPGQIPKYRIIDTLIIFSLYKDQNVSNTPYRTDYL
jgi:hypothetical protein